MHRFVSYILLISVIIVFSCTGSNKKQNESNPFSEDAIITTAERFTLRKTDSCTILTILDPWQGASGIKNEYYLVDNNKVKSIKADLSRVISVPIRTIICTSSTHLAMIAALCEEDAITGVSGLGFIYNKYLSERAELGLISDIGYDAGFNNELIVKLAPDLIMMYGIGSESAGYEGKLKELGIKVMLNADYLETDPLGKAEWIKLFGALFCKEKMADSIYRSLSESYNQIKTYISSNISSRPDIMLGLPFRDSWFISPANSYISKLIADAGGNYLWRDTESSVSTPYSLENVYLKSLNAEYWLNIGNVNSKNEIVLLDPRLEMIPAFKNNNMYNNNKRISSEGGNDYWESGTINPDRILKDIASILHPELFKDHKLFYYRKIE
jgi:iron complex transport system substrate-binding protein